MENLSSQFLLKLKKDYPMFISMAETVHEMIMLLDDKGYLVFYNKKFEEFATANELMPKTGMRPGDAFRCINALTEAGCGMAHLCRYCGAARAIQNAVEGNATFDECKVISLNGKAYDFKVSATKMLFFGKDHIMYCVNDVSGEYRKSALEKIFFHDINNLVWGLGLIVDTLSSAYEDNDNETLNDTMPLLVSSMANLTNEIKSNLLLSLAEKDELDVNPDNINVRTIMSDVMNLFREITIDKKIEFITETDGFTGTFRTDEAILKRVVINMVKNAVEASAEGQTVVAGYKKTYNGLNVYVRNQAVMPEEVKASVFKRFQSTKGSGRGLGTYSMRLLTERYLKGRIYFTSEEGYGTVFYAEIPEIP